MSTISQGVQRFQSKAAELKTTATAEDRNVKKKEIAGALYEMVRNDPLSKADKKAAEKLLDTDIPLTRGAEDLVEGIAAGKPSSLAEVMLRGASDDTSTAEPGEARIYSSLDRLNAMVKIFTKRGNGKLDRGEVDAIVGFYNGLPSSSQGKIRDRIVDIYQTAKFSSGQKKDFLEMININRDTLEGIDGGSVNVDSFDGLSDTGKLSLLHEQFTGDIDTIPEYSSVRRIRSNNVPDSVMNKIDATMEDVVQEEKNSLFESDEDPDTITVFLGESRLIYARNEDGSADTSSKLGVGVQLNASFGGGGRVDVYYFLMDGEYLGKDNQFTE